MVSILLYKKLHGLILSVFTYMFLICCLVRSLNGCNPAKRKDAALAQRPFYNKQGGDPNERYFGPPFVVSIAYRTK